MTRTTIDFLKGTGPKVWVLLVVAMYMLGHVVWDMAHYAPTENIARHPRLSAALGSCLTSDNKPGYLMTPDRKRGMICVDAHSGPSGPP